MPLSEIKPLRPPRGKGPDYKKTWRIVDGALRDAMMQHPDYFTHRGSIGSARAGLVKRITGGLTGFAEQSARGRSEGRTLGG